MAGQSTDMPVRRNGIEASDGSALPLILEHYLAYPGSYEIPLRTMYTLNCAPRSLLRPSAAATGFHESAFAPRNVDQGSSMPVADPAAQFKAHLIAKISKLPTQPCSLPPQFIISFVRRCFPARLDEVDFPQALTALDYLRDLETRRRKDVTAALKRLAVQRGDPEQKEELRNKYPGVVSWVESIEDKERKLEFLYTQVYLGVRRWTLINEMMLEPFNKPNCLAMLNTLFPPSVANHPTRQLTSEVLIRHRDGFFAYINSVEARGNGVLQDFMKQGAREGEETSWPLFREALDKYLQATGDIINKCRDTIGRDMLEEESRDWGHKRNTDSGVSFGSSDRPMTAGDRTSSGSSIDKPLPPSPEVKAPKASGSTLERIAKELRRIRSRADNKEAYKAKSGRKVASKMRSTSALDSERGHSSSSSEAEAFDVEEFKRSRLIWEAKERKKEQQGKESIDSAN